jgi:histidinol dehydrogenase
MPHYLKKSSSLVLENGTHAKGSTSVVDTVAQVIEEIRLNGDSAVRKYSEKFDQWSPPDFKLSGAQIEAIIAQVSEQTIKDIKEVQGNVRKFAEAQRQSISDFELEISPGVFLGQKNLPINRVGAYVQLPFQTPPSTKD